MSLTWSPDYAPVDENFGQVALLLKGEGADTSTTILDSSSNNLSVTANGNAQISTAVNTPFGTGDGVLAFDGVGDYAITAGSDVIASGDFTIETWAYFNTTNGAYVFDCRPSPSAPSGFYPGLFVDPSGGFSLKYFVDSQIRITSNMLIVNRWYHIAVSRNAGTTRLFVDGVASASTYSDSSAITLITATSPVIGSRSSLDVFQLDGYISNLRVTKGVARYTENFDVPTAPFPIYSPTTRAQA